MNSRLDRCPTIRNIELDFDQVETGATKIMSIKIVNQSDEKQSYYLQQDPDSNTLDIVFHTMEYSWSLKPNESYICDISFRPLIPNRKYTEYFLIIDTYNCCYRITLRGYCTGPKISSCTKRLFIMSEKVNSRTTKCFKLINSSSVAAKFMFDIDNEQGPFKVNEKSGLIKPNSSKSISVAFEPTGYGIYRYHLNCLVLHQDPINIELFGINDVDCSEKGDVDSIIFKIDEIEQLDPAKSYKNYMKDVTTSVKSHPPSISLSKNFIDFGQAETGFENRIKRTPQTISVTNHKKFDIFIIWDEDISRVFKIQPQEAKMRGGHTGIFEVRFDPTKDETFYCRELIARIFRLPCCAANFKNPMKLIRNFIPEFLSIRFIGHTYKCDLNDWIPQYEVNETIIMPACLPAMPTYTTFAIKNFGLQSLMFCFVPPDIRHFDVKPMVGLIQSHQECQLITVQLFPEAEDNRTYVERWAIRLNGNSRNTVYIDFQGYAEQACLVFGDDNCISLDPVYVGCRLVQPVPVRNKTRHNIQFKYQEECFPSMFSVSQLEGVINPNETVNHDWILSPQEIKVYDFEVSCCLNAEIGGKTSFVILEVSGKSTEGYLMAIPEELKFGDCAFNETKKLEFKIFNFSQVIINYLLDCRPTKTMEILICPEKDVKLTPSEGSISPGKSEKIIVTIKPSQPGFYELTIDYKIKVNEDLKTPGPDIEPRSICTINFNCYMPTLQVIDLLYLAENNKYVSKLSLWKSLQIDTLNSAAKNLLPMQETSIEMIVPFTNLNSNEKFTVKLKVKNIELFPATWIIKKKKVCLCKKGQNKIIMRKSRQKECLFCVHDQTCSIYPEEMSLQSKQTGVIAIQVTGNSQESSGICWKLNIGLGRNILLNIRLRSSIILSGPLLKFNSDYIGHFTDKRYQAIWLFNNTEFNSTYEVELKNLAILNKENYGIIFTCLNPKGTVEGFSRKPVFFGFYPNKIGKYETTVKIKLDEEESILHLEAEATCAIIHNEMKQETCPLADTFVSPDIMVHFNTDCIIVPTLTTHGKVARLIMLHNHHIHDVFHFEWQNFEIPGIIQVTIHPKRGLIQPHTLLTFIVETIAGFNECSLEIDLFCNLVNVSERSKLERKNHKLEDKIMKLKDEFTITEKGISYPKKPQIDETQKPSTITKTLTLKITVYNSESTNLKIETTDELKKRPPPEIVEKITTFPFSPEIIKLSSDIFECIIWEIIQSKVFSEVLTDSILSPHHLKYSQLLMSHEERKFKTESSNFNLSREKVEQLIRGMITFIVPEEFNLEVGHFAFAPDIRQQSHRKIRTHPIPKPAISEPIKLL